MVARTVRTHVVLPEELVEEMNRVIGPRKRSRFISELVEQERRRRRRVEAFDRVAGSLADVDIPGWETSESASEWVRELRRRSDRYDTCGNYIPH